LLKVALKTITMLFYFIMSVWFTGVMWYIGFFVHMTQITWLASLVNILGGSTCDTVSFFQHPRQWPDVPRIGAGIWK
jgi:hypothetical protein